MIIAINYADENFRRAQILNTKSAKRWGAKKVIEYSPKDIPEDFKEKNREIWNQKRGAGFWIWKPYIIKQTLDTMEEGDYLLYCDSGAAVVNKLQYLIEAMQTENSDIMLFSLEKNHLEKIWTKRDAFVLMECDSKEYTDTPQRLATYMIFKKSEYTMKFVEQVLEYAQNPNIVTNCPSIYGSDYEGFRENRNDQSISSLLSKKWGIVAFRDPSQYGNTPEYYTKDVLERSCYPQIFDAHRNRDITTSYLLYSIKRTKLFHLLKNIKA